MSINFPLNPNVNDEYVFGSKTWFWNGTAWALKQDQPDTLLELIKTVDGAGSGLDADTLDGSNSSVFYLASNPSGYTSNTGTVTSVTAGAGLTGGSITTSGTIELATSGVIASTYKSVTVDTYGRVTAGTNPTTLAGYGITDAQALDADLTAIAGLAGTSGFLKKTAVNTWSLDTNTYLTGNQSISVSGDATGSGTTSIALTLANSGVTAGTYTKITVDAKGRATSGTSLSSSDVTTALGYTPYNSTNPNGYITSSALSTYLPLSGGTLTGKLTISAAAGLDLYRLTFDADGTDSWYRAGSGNRHRFTTSGGADFIIGNDPGVATLNGNQVLHVGNYGSYALPLNGGTVSGDTTFNGYLQASGIFYHRGDYQVLNSSGNGWIRIMARNSGSPYLENITYAGNTILHAGNYTSYSPSLTGSGASGTWGINITGNAATATSADQIDGVGFRNTGSNSGVNADTIESNGITYYTAGVTNFSGNATDGALYSQAYSSSWQHQIAGDYRSGQIAVRGKNNGTWQSWRKVLQEDTWQGSKYFGSDGAIYGTIFYDANDGAYYVNPNGDSRLANTYTSNSYTYGWYRNYGQQGMYNQDYGTHFYSVASSAWGITGSGGAVELQFRANHQSTIRGYVYGDTSNNFGLLNQNGAWKVRVNGSEIELYDYTYANDLRTYIMYDRNNTGYYVDGNNTSRLNTVNADTLRSYNNIYLDNQYGSSIIGVYSSYRYQGVYSMGDAYKLSLDGTTTGNLYGMAWSHPNAGGIASNLNSHGLLLLQNGSFMAALSTNGTFSADVRGTIFYDYNNTGYYVDPNSTTYVYYLQSATTVRADSDRRLKDNIKPIESALSKVRQLQGCTYTRKDLEDKTKIYMGMIAQDVLPVVPEVVSGSEQGYYSLGYAELVPLLNEAIKEQDLIIQNQEARIKRLESLIEKLI